MADAPKPEQRRRRTPAISAEARAAFLEAVSAGWSVSHAADRADVHRRRFYELAKADGEFAAELRDAVQTGTHALEDEARRRAVDGVDEPVFQGGELVGHVRRYSDRLLEFLLKKRDPSYRERSEVTVAGGIELRTPEMEAALSRFNQTVERLIARNRAAEVIERPALPPAEGEVDA